MVIVLLYIERNEDANTPEYGVMAGSLMDIVSKIPGFLGIKAYSASDGESVYIIKFASESALQAWRDNEEHRRAMILGKKIFYKSDKIETCSVDRAYAFPEFAGSSRYSEESRRAENGSTA